MTIDTRDLHAAIAHDVNDNVSAARLDQARRRMIEKFAELPQPEAAADAIIAVTQRLTRLSIEEAILVGSARALPEFIALVAALTRYAVEWQYISPNDLEIGDSLAMIDALSVFNETGAITN